MYNLIGKCSKFQWLFFLPRSFTILRSSCCAAGKTENQTHLQDVVSDEWYWVLYVVHGDGDQLSVLVGIVRLEHCVRLPCHTDDILKSLRLGHKYNRVHLRFYSNNSKSRTNFQIHVCKKKILATKPGESLKAALGHRWVRLLLHLRPHYSTGRWRLQPLRPQNWRILVWKFQTINKQNNFSN